MCFGRGGGNTAPPPAPTPGLMGDLKAKPDTSEAAVAPWRGSPVGPDTTGRYGGELLTGAITPEAAVQKRSLLGR